MVKQREFGFTIVEVMIAIVILTLGLLGVAGMQSKAMQGNLFAGKYTEGGAVGERWMEWLMLQPYEKVAAVDISDDDSLPTERQVPDTSAGLIAAFQQWGLGTFTESQLPKPLDNGCSMIWRVTANAPVLNTTTVEIETQISIKKLETSDGSDSAIMNKPIVFRFMVSSHM